MDDWLQPALRFLHYALLLGLFGWAGFRVVGLRQVNCTALSNGRLTALVAAALAPVVSAVLMLASIAAMMAQPLTTLDWSVIEAMTMTTDMGWAFLARIGLLGTGFVALVAERRVAAALCFGAALITLGWSGHAAATEGAVGIVHRIGNGVHLLAAGLWLGAIGWFVYLTVVAHRYPGRVSPVAVLTAMHRFAPLGVALVAFVSITGLLNAHLIFGLENSAATLMTSYGVLLAAKVVIVGGMLALGAHNARVSRRGLAPDQDAEQSYDVALATLRRSLPVELMLGIVVLASVASLGMWSPMTID